MAHPHQPALLHRGQAFGRADVGGKDFERGVAIYKGIPHLSNHVEEDFPDEHTVVRVIAVRVATPRGRPLVDRLRNVNARMLDGRVRERGRTSEECRSADGLRRLRDRTGIARHRGGDMGMGLNPPGDYDFARGVNHSSDVAT